MDSILSIFKKSGAVRCCCQTLAHQRRFRSKASIRTCIITGRTALVSSVVAKKQVLLQSCELGIPADSISMWIHKKEVEECWVIQVEQISVVKSCLLKPLSRLWTVSKSSLVMEEVMALITSSQTLRISTIWYVSRPETRKCWAIWLILTSPNSCGNFAVVIVSALSRAQQPRGRSWNTVQWLSTHAHQSSQAWPPTQVTHGQVTIYGEFQSSWPVKVARKVVILEPILELWNQSCKTINTKRACQPCHLHGSDKERKGPVKWDEIEVSKRSRCKVEAINPVHICFTVLTTRWSKTPPLLSRQHIQDGVTDLPRDSCNPIPNTGLSHSQVR